MLNEILQVFRRSVAAFRDEAGSMEPEDQVASLLAAMRKELVAARAAIPEFEAELGRAGADLTAENEALSLCERRGALARRIGDEETARVADEFAARHRGRIVVLEQRLATARAELDLHRREADEMKRRYQDADANRFALLAQVRRASSSTRVSSDEGSAFADWSRMEEKLERDISVTDALEELDGSPAAPPRPDPAAVEAKLEELKRRMGRQ